MQKKIIVLLVFSLFLIHTACFGQELKEYILNEDCVSINFREKNVKKHLKDENINIRNFFYFGSEINTVYYGAIKDEDEFIPLNKFQTHKISNELPKDFFSSYESESLFLYPKYVIDAVFQKDRNYITKFDKHNTDIMTSNYDIEEIWYMYEIQPQLISDKGLNIGSAYALNNLLIKDIKKIKNDEYSFETVIIKPSLNRLLNPLFEKYSDGDIIILRLKKDGDYLEVYVENESKPREIYCYVDNMFRVNINSLIKDNTIISNNITWPCHADGSCDYETKKTLVAPSNSATNVSINKEMSAKENLKLRSGEATTSNVLTVMSAGSKVKIIELGKVETIDGINSNWVKVEIISGNDRDGNKLKSGMTGWCYGGYLQ